jgi:Amt family ammonium transporter
MKKVIATLLLVMISTGICFAGDEPPTVISNKEAIDLVQTHANFLWTLVAAALVFFMQAGFAMVEAGFTRAKNAVNIMMKNLMDFSMGSLAYWAIGFGLMFGATTTGWFGTTDFFLSGFTGEGTEWVLAFWMFRCLCRHGRHHRLRRHGRADQIQRLPYLQLLYQRLHLPHLRQLGLGKPA